jgi:hypothetical protein
VTDDDPHCRIGELTGVPGITWIDHAQHRTGL